MLEFLALLAVTLGWLLLPMIPALRELFRPTDVAPLTVVDRSSGDVAYFAKNFRRYLDRQMADYAAPPETSEQQKTLPDGTAFVRVEHPAQAVEPESEERVQRSLVVAERPITLSGGETFLMEVFARDAFNGGPNGVYRALYGSRKIWLGEGTRVLRWVHAADRLVVGAHSVLRGRVSSDLGVSLGGGVVFERIGAPVIAVGLEHEPPPDPPALPKEFKLPAGTRRIGNHLRVLGNLDIPEGVRVASSLVVNGTLRIGMGTIVEGSVKAHRDVELADEAQVRGAVVARRRVMTGAAAWIEGPVIAEERIRLGRGAVVGAPYRPATVSAPEVEMAGGSTVYGQISAPRGGRTF
jgi:cytoskeletal protein CcmA (bactofilin family)